MDEGSNAVKYIAPYMCTQNKPSCCYSLEKHNNSKQGNTTKISEMMELIGERVIAGQCNLVVFAWYLLPPTPRVNWHTVFILVHQLQSSCSTGCPRICRGEKLVPRPWERANPLLRDHVSSALYKLCTSVPRSMARLMQDFTSDSSKAAPPKKNNTNSQAAVQPCRATRTERSGQWYI